MQSTEETVEAAGETQPALCLLVFTGKELFLWGLSLQQQQQTFTDNYKFYSIAAKNNHPVDKRG